MTRCRAAVQYPGPEDVGGPPFGLATRCRLDEGHEESGVAGQLSHHGRGLPGEVTEVVWGPGHDLQFFTDRDDQYAWEMPGGEGTSNARQ